MKSLFATMKNLIPLYKSEGKSYLNIGIGCTGGKHRSVASAEYLHSQIEKAAAGISYILEHRDIDI